jgi:REP element-mobilizing transposase RayT
MFKIPAGDNNSHRPSIWSLLRTRMSALRHGATRQHFGLFRTSVFHQIQCVPEPKRTLPSPPYNPGVRDLVEGKQQWDLRASEGNKQHGFRGWHERGYLPHRDSPGLTQFITYHLADAFPSELLVEWAALLKIEEEAQKRRELEQYLDKGRGQCWLRRPEVAVICEAALRHFDGERYQLRAWCLMPNHVHVLVSVMNVPMAEFVKSWKGYTAFRCRRLLGLEQKNFWADDYWDTYIRDPEHESRTIRYIENNPARLDSIRWRSIGSAAVLVFATRTGYCNSRWFKSNPERGGENGILQLPMV